MGGGGRESLGSWRGRRVVCRWDEGFAESTGRSSYSYSQSEIGVDLGIVAVEAIDAGGELKRAVKIVMRNEMRSARNFEVENIGQHSFRIRIPKTWRPPRTLTASTPGVIHAVPILYLLYRSHMPFFDRLLPMSLIPHHLTLKTFHSPTFPNR